jgi:hypothetical protein
VLHRAATGTVEAAARDGLVTIAVVRSVTTVVVVNIFVILPVAATALFINTTLLVLPALVVIPYMQEVDLPEVLDILVEVAVL